MIFSTTIGNQSWDHNREASRFTQKHFPNRSRSILLLFSLFYLYTRQTRTNKIKSKAHTTESIIFARNCVYMSSLSSLARRTILFIAVSFAIFGTEVEASRFIIGAGGSFSVFPRQIRQFHCFYQP